MTRRGDGIAVLLAVLLLVMPAVTASASAPSPRPAVSDPVSADVPAPVEPIRTISAGNNSTVPHENPADVEEEGDLSSVQVWLSGRIETTLADCARRAGVAANGTCAPIRNRSLQRTLVTKYRITANATETPSDDNAARALNRTAERQLLFTRTVVRYRSTLSAYRTARQEGQVRRARVLARTVSVRGSRAVTIGRQLSSDYGIIAGNSTMNVAPARDIVRSTTGNISATIADVRTASFTSPGLNVSTNRTTASFAEPVRIRGQLRTPDGQPLVDGRIVVRTPEGTVRTTTTTNGTFGTTYRPTAVSTGNATIVVQYRPTNDTEFLGTTARANVSIRQSTGRIRSNASPSTVAYGENVTVRGTVRVAGTNVSDAPLVMRVDGSRVATGETNDTGRFRLSARIPATVPNGSTQVTVEPVRRGMAVDAEPTSAPIRIPSSTPRLIAGTERINTTTVRVFGRVLVNEQPVPGGTVRIGRDDDTLATVRPTAAGTFERNVSLSGLSANATTALTASYRPPEGNLEPVTLQVAVRTVPRELPSLSDLGPLARAVTLLNRVDPLPLSIGVLALSLVFLAASGAAYRSRDRLRLGSLRHGLAPVASALGLAGDVDAGRTQPDDTGPSAVGESTPDTDFGAIPDAAPGAAFLHAARTQLDENRPNDAVVAAYTAVRRHLNERFDVDPALTHWEFLAVHADSLDGDDRDALRQLTAAYESAAFSPAEGTPDTARVACENAVSILKRGERERPADSADD